MQIVKEPFIEAKQAIVVMSPLYNLQQPGNLKKFAVLLERHVQVRRCVGCCMTASTGPPGHIDSPRVLAPVAFPPFSTLPVCTCFAPFACPPQWHQALGFSRHLLYIRPGDVQSFLQMPSISHLLEAGRLQLVEWQVGC